MWVHHEQLQEDEGLCIDDFLEFIWVDIASLVLKFFLVDFVVEHCEADDLAVVRLCDACTAAVFHDVLGDERGGVDSLCFEECESRDGFLVVAELKTLHVGVGADGRRSWRRSKKNVVGGGVV